MNKRLILAASLLLACGYPAIQGFTAQAQSTQSQGTVTGVLTDEQGEPIVGAMVENKATKAKVLTDVDGRYTIKAAPGDVLSFNSVGMQPADRKVSSHTLNVILTANANALDEVVVTALGIKKDKKSLGYSIDEISADELMKNKTSNAINSLSGKIAGVNITQSSGAAGSGAQIVLRGATSVSETRDSQPLFVVDGIIYDNSSSVGGNSAFDGSTNTSTTTSNRVMDINPEDIESMSVLKGPAASALYGSRAANGVVLITTKKGKAGRTEVNLSAKYVTSWATKVPKAQTRYRRGFMEDQYVDKVYTGTVYNDYSYSSWGDRLAANEQTYDNIGDFYQHGGIWDTNLSVSGGNENGNFFLSGSFYDQDGIVPKTGYTKTTVRFNGEQKWKMFTFGANAAYSEARTDKTLTSGGLYNSSGDGALVRLYGFGTSDDMTHYLNEDGSRYRMFGDRLDAKDESDNPYWIINKNKIHDKTTRFTGTFNIRADVTDWWWIRFQMGVDDYTTDYTKRIAPGGVYKEEWQSGMMSDNTTRYHYLNTNFMMNFNKTFGDFGTNLLIGTSTDNTTTKNDYKMAYNFEVANFFAYANAAQDNKSFESYTYKKRLVGLYGELRLDWKNTVFLTATGRNDWTSTLPHKNRSYFYPSVSGAIAFTQFLQDHGWLDNSVLTFGKIRASWARVGKDTDPYELTTTLWPVGTYLGGLTGMGNSWTRGNTDLKSETTESTEIGLELHFFNNRLKFDYAYYTNNSLDQIISPRGPQSTGYIFCSVNMGNVRNKGMELSISGIPVQTKDWQWETGINIAGNRGKLEGLAAGMDVMYVTDVQYGGAKAASYSGGDFCAIAGTRWVRDDDGNVVVNAKTGLPDNSDTSYYYLGNREPKFTGGWTNTLTWKNFTFDMLWEFRVGGYVFNGTQYVMDVNGTSNYSADIRDNGLDIPHTDLHYDWDKTYDINGVTMSGASIIHNYLSSVASTEASLWLKKVNSLRLRTISLSYNVPKKFLERTKVFQRAVVTASATNLLLFTNYDGDPEAAASGAGVGGSSSVGFEYCGVPSTASFAFGLNLTF